MDIQTAMRNLSMHVRGMALLLAITPDTPPRTTTRQKGTSTTKLKRTDSQYPQAHFLVSDNRSQCHVLAFDCFCNYYNCYS